MIYLDHNATTPVLPEVATAMAHCLRHTFGNPSSSHAWGQKAKKAVDEAREQVGELIHARPDEIFFTSGGTEANNMAILGTAARFSRGHIISSSIEHPSVLNPLKHLGDQGRRITCLPVNQYGIVEPRLLERHLGSDTILITVMHANNETGSLQPIAELGTIARSRGVLFHCDAAQSVGKVPVNVQRLNVDLLTIVPHKFYGPKGTGALYVRRGTELKPILFGASHERGLRPGTENVCALVGFGKAAAIAKRDMKSRVTEMRKLSTLLYKELMREIPGLKLNGHPRKRLPNTLNLSFPGVTGSALLDNLKGTIAASTGSACHAGRHTPSPVLKAMGLSDEEALSAVRLSLGTGTGESQIRLAVKAIAGACRSL
ncbi:MAG: cysteine desulfurase [Nitrospiraceae bacterium]|nr:MAG: cysteine desulfurase [Nitrospiraceae bacterium]